MTTPTPASKDSPTPSTDRYSVSLADLDRHKITRLSNDKFRSVLQQVLTLQRADRKENQLLYYKPVSENAEQIHRSTAKYVGVGGGNGSSKTETCLAHLAMLATGIIPDSVPYMADQFRGPINARVVLESLTTVLHQIMLAKLQWWKWTGVGMVGSDQGHFGWIPKTCLIDGSWERSWSEKLRTLRVLCHDVNAPDRVVGESTIQFMSHDQDPSDFASGDFHFVLHDEPPSYAIWTENEARTMRVDGRMFLAMTWPDDPSIPVDWIFDDLYEKGRPGPNKSPDHDWFELYTTDNPHLNQQAVARQMHNWSDETVGVRIYGRPIRFSNRIHPLFTDIESWWCYNCKKPILPRDGICETCGSRDVSDYNHVQDFLYENGWPVVWLLDPHPRKPHMWLWAMIDPADDIWVIAEGESSGDPADVHDEVSHTEEALGFNVVQRLIDPNMGRSPASSKRNVTWQDEFGEAGLYCDLADDSDVGRGRINEYLKPDPFRLQPRLHLHVRCVSAAFQMKRYTWDENRAKLEKDLKQKPRPKYDDYPTLLKYLMNTEPTFAWLREGPPIIRPRGKRSRGY